MPKDDSMMDTAITVITVALIVVCAAILIEEIVKGGGLLSHRHLEVVRDDGSEAS